MEQDPFAQYAVAPAPKPAPQPDPFAAYAVTKPEAPPDKRSFWEKALDTVIPTGLRVGGAVAGGAVGAFGGPIGVVAGGAAGSGVGETAAELYEQWRGQREDLNPWQIATQTGLGAIPVVGRAGGTIARNVIGRGVQGGVMGGVSSAATELAEGRTPTLGGVATGTALGTVLGAGAGRLESRALAGRAARSLVDDIPDAAPAAPAAPAPKPRISAEEYLRLKAERESASSTPAPEIVNTTEKHVAPPLRKIEQTAKAAGKPIPEQQPLDAARIKGEEDFLATQPEPFRDGLSQILENRRHFDAQRRGVQPVERTNELAKWIQVERQKALPKGTALNAEELTAYKNAVASASDEVTDLSTKVRAGEASPRDQARLLQATQEQVALLANAMGARAEAGRALNSLKGMAELIESGDGIAMAAFLKEAKRAGLDPMKLAAEFATKTTPQEKLEFIQGLRKTKAYDWASGVFYSNILSGPRTHIRNIVGNFSNAVFRSVAHTAAVPVDMTRAALPGRTREVFAGEVGARAQGLAVGIKQGIDDAWHALREGFTRNQLETFDVARKELPGKGANPLNWTGRALEAMDQFFYSVNYKSDLYARLYAKGHKEGLRGKALDTQIAKWALDPPKDVKVASHREALRSVYKEDGGKWVEAAMTAKNKVKALNFVIPFARTPGNIIRQGIEATPLAAMTKQTRDALKAGGREGSEAVARMATGTAALAGLAWWAGMDNISGSGPSKPAERAALMEDGWLPNAVRFEIGGKPTWIEFSYFTQPLSTALFALANAKDKWQQGEEFDPMKVAVSSASAVMDQSFLSGASDLNNALSDPDRYFNQFLERQVQGWVPFSGAARNVAQAIDPVVREPKGIAESAQAIIPVASKSLDPKIGRLGQTIERAGGPAVRVLSPANVGRGGDDPIIAELNRLNVKSLGLPPKVLEETARFPRIELTVEERRQVGQATKAALERLFSRAGFRSLDEERAKDLIRTEVQQARSRAYQQIRLARQR